MKRFVVIIVALMAWSVSACTNSLPVTMEVDGRQYSIVVEESLDAGFNVTVTDAASFIVLPQRQDIQKPLMTAAKKAIGDVCSNGVDQVISIPTEGVISKKFKVYCANSFQKNIEQNIANVSGKNPSSMNETFPQTPFAVNFIKVKPRPDDIAVIIGNADYSRGRDIPNVTPAYADANGIRRYVRQALGVRDENIIFLKDATQAEMTSTFGTKDNPKGQLFNYVTPGKSRVFVYYSGHGAPGGKDGDSYIVPSDAQASTIDLNGYPLKTLYRNLSAIPAKSITVVLEACFSGASQSGTVISNASPIYLKAKETGVPANITLIAAGAANQIASWEQDSSSGLFTEYFLKGMSGKADAKPYGNGDGKVGYAELGRYLKGTMTYYARRYYGREQTAQIVVGKRELAD